ncbi:MAG TPA: cytochrome c family protein [Stellaceae bacterium]|jgi:cytochrome c
MIRLAAMLPLLLVLMAMTIPAGAQSAGGAVFNRCKVCHSLAAGAHSPVGPNLHELYGRTAGTEAGFAFSPAMQKSGVVWNDDTLAKFLRDPQGFIPGNRMGFPGIKDDKALIDLLAYLKQATQ